MSLRKKGVITKISSIALFVFLMLFNVKVAFSDKSTGDIDILGMQISVFVPSAYATEREGPFYKVTCRYDGVGHLLSIDCEPTSDRYCECP